MSSEIHISCGDSALGNLLTVVPVPISDWLTGWDRLSFGPLPPIRSLPDWLRMRVDYWSEIFRDDRSRRFEFTQGWHLQVSGPSLSAADSIMFWMGSGLDDQLMLAWFVQFSRIANIDLTKVRVIQFRKSPNTGRRVASLDTLHPEELANHPTPKELSKPDIKLLDAIWNAVTSPEPDTLVAFLQKEKTYTTRLFHRNLRRMIWRYPSASSGVGVWEFKLLQKCVAHGPNVLEVIGQTIREAFSSTGQDELSDVWLFPRLLRVGNESLPYPLITIEGDHKTYRGTKVYLTDIGRQVLAGKANFVELNGIDDWVGGVHLESSKGRVWYRKGNGLVRG